MAEIDINDITPREQYVATAGQTVFPYPFPVFDEAHIVVLRTRDGTTTTIAAADYTVDGVGTDDGGNVTLDSGADEDDIITVYRDVPIERVGDFAEAGDFFARDVNRELDLQVMMLQQLERDLARSVQLPPEDTVETMVIPALAVRAGNVWYWNADGELEPISIDDLGIEIGATAVTSAAAAAASATAAAGSATTAATSATTATTQATNAASSAAAAAASAASVDVASGSFTGTLTGMSGATSGTFFYSKVGNFVTLWLGGSGLSGTSNTNAFTITGVPAAIQCATSKRVITEAIDNNAVVMAFALTGTGGAITMLTSTGGSNSWTASSTKGFPGNWSLTYNVG